MILKRSHHTQQLQPLRYEHLCRSSGSVGRSARGHICARDWAAVIAGGRVNVLAAGRRRVAACLRRVLSEALHTCGSCLLLPGDMAASVHADYSVSATERACAFLNYKKYLHLVSSESSQTITSPCS